jgi:hypothetical protein
MTIALKHSYTVACSSDFRQAVESLAASRKVNVGDLARSILLVVPPAVVESFPDPGEPPPHDRETVILKSGPAKGRPWRRKPRLQVRMPPGYAIPFIRKALALALSMARGELSVLVADRRHTAPAERKAPEPVIGAEAEEELERLKAIISALSFEPLPEGVKSRDDALHILGFAPRAYPDARTLKAKFRMLATIHHPDSELGSHQRMSQLNQAMELLRNGAV